MIELITGKPGAGKTYLVVERLMDLPKGKWVIYHNIAGLKESAMPEPDLVKRIPDDPAWFGKEEQIKWAAAVRAKYGRNMLIVVDEAQMLFADRDAAKKGWLSWHRHLGQEIWLVCQHNKMIHSDYYVLIEYEVRALKSRLLPGLVYQYRMGGEAFKTMRRKKRDAVYAAYASFDQPEIRHGNFRLVYYGAGICVLAVVGFFLTHYMVTNGVGAALPVGGVTEKKEVEKKKRKRLLDGKTEVEVSPWDCVRYAGMIGGRVLVQTREGVLTDLGSVVGERYGVVSANNESCRVITAKGEKIVKRGVPLNLDKITNDGGRDKPRDGSLPRRAKGET